MKRAVLLIVALFLVSFMISGVSAFRTGYSRGIDYQLDIVNYTASNEMVTSIVAEDTSTIKIIFNCPDGLDCVYLSDNTIGTWDGKIKLTYQGKDYFSTEYSRVLVHALGYTGWPNGFPVKDSTIWLVSDVVLISGDNSTFVGQIALALNPDGQGAVQITGNVIENQEPRISALESWRTTISTSLDLLWQLVESNTARIGILETYGSPACTLCENQSTSSKYDPYFKYIDLTNKKNMVCGYGKDNSLAYYSDLGVGCNVTYKTNSYRAYNYTSHNYYYYNKTTSSCNCKQI